MDVQLPIPSFLLLMINS